MRKLQKINPEAEETSFIKMKEEEEIVCGDNEGEETKIKSQKT